MTDPIALRYRRSARRLHSHLAHRQRPNIISQRVSRGRGRLSHPYGVATAIQPLPAHHLTASNNDLDHLTTTLNLFDAGHADG
ncbi:hypothetical protein [Hyphomicrobium sp.]|uniref:hypothetical protein n=1 Tax=Hyphomicrobium sp. TaxID=82 RepID=UPI002D79DAAD|nr:hypothetical protein [Hyphomicrobium sp.]HET6389611.1 hypothetical protein [Hyphomicrobium sp.]